MSAAVPAGVFDVDRLAAVRATRLLDTGAEESFDRLARLAALLLQTPYAFVTIVDETRSFWKSCIGVESTDPVDRQNRVEESFCQYVIGTGDAVLIGDAAAHPMTADNPSITTMGVAAWAGFPLRAPNGAILGTFCVVDTVVRTWSDRDVEILGALAASASSEVALRDALAMATSAADEAARAQQRLAFLDEVGEVLADTADPEGALGRLAESMVPLLGDWCLITAMDSVSGLRREIGHAHRDPSRLAEVARYAGWHDAADDAPMMTALRTGTPVIVRHLDESLIERAVPDARARAALTTLAPESVAVYPLTGRGAPFGAITLLNGRERGAHTEVELSIAHEMARRAGLSLENAFLHGRQRSMAETLQRSLLSSPPDVAGLQIAVRYRPASSDAHVGGDWYDVYRRADGEVMLVVGDVIGHDVHAISVMGQLRTMMRSIGFDRTANPAAILSRVDCAMTGLGVSSLATAIVVEVGRRSDDKAQLTWSSAGHPLPLLIDRDGTVTELEGGTNLLLGYDPHRPRDEHHATLHAGQTLVLMSDGLFEQVDEDYAVALERLRERLAPLAQLSLDELCEAIVKRRAEDGVEDDIAVLALRLADR